MKLCDEILGACPIVKSQLGRVVSLTDIKPVPKKLTRAKPGESPDYEYQRAYREAHAEELAAAKADWARNNRAHKRAYQRVWMRKKRGGTTSNYHYGSSNPHAKLTEDRVRAMRAARKQGATVPALAAEYGVSIAMVSKITRGLAWAHVKDE